MEIRWAVEGVNRSVFGGVNGRTKQILIQILTRLENVYI